MNTRVAKKGLSFELPGEWLECNSSEGFDFVNESLGEQLIVAVMEAKKNLSDRQIKKSVSELLEIRKQAIKELSNRCERIEGTGESMVNSCIGQMFRGVDSTNGVRFSIHVFGCPTKLVSMSFYRYCLDEEKEFEERVRDVLCTVSVTSG